jgi:hypothetical protein
VRLAINVSALGITLLTAVGCGPATAPSDASIIARFNAHRAEYVKIFKTIGCDGAVYYSPGSKANASFSMWSVGMLFAGQDKSIMLFRKLPATKVCRGS